MQIVLLNDCCVDGCYKKKIAKSAFCKKHKKDYEEGKSLSVMYGKKIQKKETVNEQH